MHIGIAGAGIGGLAAAALLAADGHRITVFDQFDAPRPVGSGLVIQPVGQAVLAEIGALDAARTYGNPVSRMLGHEAQSGRRVLDVWYDRKNGNRCGLGIHRFALFQALFDAAQAAGAVICAGKPVARTEGGILHFADGRHDGPFDLIIDSAGAASPLSPMQSRPLPYGAVWGTVDWPETDLPWGELRQRYRRASHMAGVLPVGQLPEQTGRKAAIFWSLPVASQDEWRDTGIDAWIAEASTLWPEFAPFAGQITRDAQMTMARYTHGTLRRPWSPGLVHIGDAAHRTSPQLGHGANMALLDALALARALRVARGDAALALYAKARRWHVRVYQMMSAAFTPQYQSDSHWLPVLRDNVLFPLSMVPPVPHILTALVCGTMLPPTGRLKGQRQ